MWVLYLPVTSSFDLITLFSHREVVCQRTFIKLSHLVISQFPYSLCRVFFSPRKSKREAVLCVYIHREREDFWGALERIFWLMNPDPACWVSRYRILSIGSRCVRGWFSWPVHKLINHLAVCRQGPVLVSLVAEAVDVVTPEGTVTVCAVVLERMSNILFIPCIMKLCIARSKVITGRNDWSRAFLLCLVLC